jgi:hypothetical protein
MNGDVLPLPGPEKAHCACGACDLYGRPNKIGHIRGCPCRRCLGKRSRSKGDLKARQARKALGIPGANSRHEEVWGGPVRVEVKAGGKANVVRTAYLGSERQSEGARPLGDPRPFLAVFAPDGWSDELLVLRRSRQIEVAVAILTLQGYEVKGPS